MPLPWHTLHPMNHCNNGTPAPQDQEISNRRTRTIRYLDVSMGVLKIIIFCNDLDRQGQDSRLLA